MKKLVDGGQRSQRTDIRVELAVLAELAELGRVDAAMHSRERLRGGREA